MNNLRLISVFIAVSFLLSMTGTQHINSEKVTSSIEWTNTEHDFGKIKQGIPVTATFEFKNTSMVPLIISSVEPQCGCTVAKYPKEPVKYGKTGNILISFDAKNQGYFQKSVTVVTNTEEATTTLVIKGEVVLQLK